MEMNKKPEHLNDIVGSEKHYTTLKERVLGSKAAKTVVYTIGGIVLAGYICLASSLTALAGDPPTPPFPPGQETREPSGEHYGRDKINGNKYGFKNINKGEKNGWVIKVQ